MLKSATQRKLNRITKAGNTKIKSRNQELYTI